MIRSAKATAEVARITLEESSETEAAAKGDPRFIAPGARRRIKEDSGTYSVVYKRR